MDQLDYTAANRDAWNEVAPKHQQAAAEKLIQKFSNPGYSGLDEFETPRLEKLDFKGKRIAHPCCNSGVELLSLTNLGAKSCTGFDISAQFIEQAQGLAKVANIDCEFVECDVYQIPDQYLGAYDIVYISVGTLGWMPDLFKFFSISQSLLKEGGKLFIYEMHPILDMLSVEPERGTTPIYSYFRREPIVEDHGLDYLGGTQYKAKTMFWFHHKVSDVITAILQNGFEITSFEEFGHDVSATFDHLSKLENRLPLSYILTGKLGER